MKKCYIFGAGSYFGLRERPQAGDLILAADGGWLPCRSEGLTPDLLLGDFDSLPEVPAFENILRVAVEKDDTDTLLAVKTGLQRGCEVFYLYGCTGGRLDHTLANLQTLLFLKSHGARGYLFDDGFCYTAIENETISVAAGVGKILSVFCFGDFAKGVTLAGVHYPLTEATLTARFPLGVSNKLDEAIAQVTVGEGALVVGWEI